ncbi:MAG: aldehyde ferredoxin oxidoreductase family protein [Phycisphaerae bacterium]|nr:aldehyde ferredoxin oxidoreductase family protein [Phycisphaerae bacterium]
MSNGYWQKMLRINLTDRTSRVESINEADLRAFVGGAGLAAEILRREIPDKIDAYDPKNLVIFATGPFQGSAVPGSAKFSIVGISPLTGTFADTAAGANWGPSLKDAGYDLLVLEGQADSPVFIQVVDSDVQIINASDLWGKDTFETDTLIHESTGDKKLSIACIGPAGENRVAIACVAVDKHSFAGRCGLGAVMGAKKVKAVAVRGTQKVPVHDPAATSELTKKFMRQIHDTVLKNDFRAHGTPGLCETAEGLGDMPIKYWTQDTWPEGAKKLGAPNYTDVLKAKPWPCKYCPIGCHRKVTVSEPAEYALDGVPGPEYETLGLMGTNLLIDDPKVVAMANDLANRVGVDTISVGAMVGFAIECFDKGYLTLEQTGGLTLKWGDAQTLLELTDQIGRCRDFGALFAGGTLKAAEQIHANAVEDVVHCKGLDLPAHDPRACISLAPTYATGTRGACHFRGPCEDIEMGGFFMPEAGIEEGCVKFFEPDNQSLVAVKAQDLGVLCNSLVLCLFMVDGGDWSLTDVTAMFNAITGWDFTVEKLLETGERGFTVQRLNNLRDGYHAAKDVLPKKMFNAAKEGFRAGKAIPFEALMKTYYEIRGWDAQGKPSEDVMKKLELA